MSFVRIKSSPVNSFLPAFLSNITSNSHSLCRSYATNRKYGQTQKSIPAKPLGYCRSPRAKIPYVPNPEPIKAGQEVKLNDGSVYYELAANPSPQFVPVRIKRKLLAADPSLAERATNIYKQQQQQNQNNNENTLPPAVGQKPEYTTQLTEQDFQQIRELRQSDPHKYSVIKLSKMFKCSRLAISAYAPAPIEKRKADAAARETELLANRHLLRRQQLRDLQKLYKSEWTA